ncbi:MAG: ABC transporter ATP-binding protein/permease [Anaerolineae bacterium]|nr:ABC transporter ATP-binding protein/permease [Anaerolineae bacterium]MCO5206681.1 ABC transporter ATP-binding protein/permease [Anaerolineae bacterium]
MSLAQPLSKAEFSAETRISTDQTTPGRWVWSHLNHHRLLFAVLFIGAFGNAALAALVPIMIGTAFDAAQIGDMTTIGWIAVGIVVTQAVRAVLQLGRNFSAELIGQRIERDAREELYVSLLGKSMTFHDLQPVGDTMARATNDVRELNLMISPGINLVVGSSMFVIMPLILSARYAPVLVLAPLFFVVFYILSLWRYLHVLRPIADRVRNAFGILNSRLAEAIDGIELVKGAGQETMEIGRFETNAHTYRDAVVDQGRVEARFIPLLLLGLTQAIGFTMALILYGQGELQVGDVIGYMGLLTLFGFPTFISLAAYSQVARGMAGSRRILSLMQTENNLGENADGVSAEMVGAVRFENVTFGYVADVDVLQGISFDVEAGQTIAIVGQTGSGKSTIAKLVNRTYDVNAGHVLVDGIDVRDWNLAALRRQISIIEQDIFLFSRSIADNIAFGNPEATRDVIEAAARAAQAHEFIMGFPEGYETVIGERGVTLSGGQRQRLALARAFLTQPRILILDDSTSAVDSATEDRIQKAITGAAANQTTFLITHRLSQIRWADKVVLLRKGRVVAVGNHDELMQDFPAYRRIFEQYEG